MQEPMHPAARDGLLVVDKPRGLTSRDVVDRVQRCLPRGVRVGHAGTLDPLATGVLVTCIGVATRFIEYVQRMEKVYRTTARLGARSSTDDAEGAIQQSAVGQLPGRAEVEQRLATLIGEIDQVPPAFSAARVSGRRAYKLARAGKAVALEPRRVFVYEISLLSFEDSLVELEVRCGKGTYIRSLVRDLGERLGCGAYVETLRRTRIGLFTEKEAAAIEAIDAPGLQLLPSVAALAEIPSIALTLDQAVRLARGQCIHLDPIPGQEPHSGPEFAVFDSAGSLVGVAVLDAAQRLLRPVKIMPSSSDRPENAR
jgi:tRNA pseudouridine55 synthase